MLRRRKGKKRWRRFRPGQLEEKGAYGSAREYLPPSGVDEGEKRGENKKKSQSKRGKKTRRPSMQVSYLEE